MTHRQKQILYVVSDLLAAEMVWLCFLWFRWLVYDGHIFNMDSVLIPTFQFYPPLIIYPIVCGVFYYLSGFYLRPFFGKLTDVLSKTLLSSVVITLVFFFGIVIDDPVENYTRYIVSLFVLFGLQFGWCLLPRVIITLVSRRHEKRRVRTIHGLAEAQQIQRNEVDEVIIDLKGDHSQSERTLYAIINRLYPLDVEISVVPRVYDMLTGAARIVEIEDQPLVRITEHTMSDQGLCIKRAADVVASLCFMILFSPVYLALAIAVACSSKGPILYRQERIGLHGVPFQILKFRTMVVGAEQGVPQLSQDNDPRTTKIGHFLRKYRLDELPQMWNILRGDMSIVGPRPERAYFIEQIVQQAPYYCLLYKIRPGLTSWGPIRVGYTDTIEKMVERLNYDITYMENMSIRLDLKILFYTIRVIIDGKGR